jgi:hypothetical protein
MLGKISTGRTSRSWKNRIGHNNDACYCSGTNTTGNSPHLSYDVYVYDTGAVKLQAYLSPTLNFHNDEGLKYAISIDDEAPQIVVINKDDNNTRVWEGWMANNIIIKTTNHRIANTGKHVIKFWMVSPAVVLQKLVGDMGGCYPVTWGRLKQKYRRQNYYHSNKINQ